MKNEKGYLLIRGAWYALVDKNDPDHKEAASFIRNNKIPLLTTNFVFDEIITLLEAALDGA